MKKVFSRPVCWFVILIIESLHLTHIITVICFIHKFSWTKKNYNWIPMLRHFSSICFNCAYTLSSCYNLFSFCNNSIRHIFGTSTDFLIYFRLVHLDIVSLSYSWAHSLITSFSYFLQQYSYFARDSNSLGSINFECNFLWLRSSTFIHICDQDYFSLYRVSRIRDKICLQL